MLRAPLPFLIAALSALAAPAVAAPRVVADIAPVHSILSRVMGDLGTPELLVPPGASPHGYALRPSQAAALAAADLVVWVGPSLEPWLQEPIAALAEKAEVLTLAEQEGVVLLPLRDAGDVGAGGAQAEEHDHGPAGAEGHDHGPAGGVDPHLWLDPENGAVLARAIAEALARQDPDHAAAYRAEAQALAAELSALQTEIAGTLAPVRSAGFVVFHDAFQYFEARFGIASAGSIALGDGTAPSAARLAAIRDRIAEAGIACVFAEPQFSPGLIASATEGADVRTAVLDPLGSAHAPGPELYPALLGDLAAGIAGCAGG